MAASLPDILCQVRGRGKATAVTPQGRITPGCTGIWNDQRVEALIPITRFVEQLAIVPGSQTANTSGKDGYG
jgi:hypothetical protein